MTLDGVRWCWMTVDNDLDGDNGLDDTGWRFGNYYDAGWRFWSTVNACATVAAYEDLLEELWVPLGFWATFAALLSTGTWGSEYQCGSEFQSIKMPLFLHKHCILLYEMRFILSLLGWRSCTNIHNKLTLYIFRENFNLFNILNFLIAKILVFW